MQGEMDGNPMLEKGVSLVVGTVKFNKKGFFLFTVSWGKEKLVSKPTECCSTSVMFFFVVPLKLYKELYFLKCFSARLAFFVGPERHFHLRQPRVDGGNILYGPEGRLRVEAGRHLPLAVRGARTEPGRANQCMGQGGHEREDRQALW